MPICKIIKFVGIDAWEHLHRSCELILTLHFFSGFFFEGEKWKTFACTYQRPVMWQDGAVHITETLARGPQELVKLDLSCTGLTFHATKRICENIVLAGSVLELNLGGNSILQEVCIHFHCTMNFPTCQ